VATRRWARLIGMVVVGGTLVAWVGAATGTAAATTVQGSAYVWADQPWATYYTPFSTYQFNSSGAVNTISRSGVGRYTVHVPRLGSDSGTVLVTAYGSSADQCKVAWWYNDESAQEIEVRCFDQAGAPTDSRFTMSYTNQVGGASGVRAYVWADQPTAEAEYSPAAAYQANYTGASNRVKRNSVGSYRVYLPVDFVGLFGHMQVTAYGTGPERCKVDRTFGWFGGPEPTVFIDVACFTSAGAPVDTKFTLTYAQEAPIIGASGHASLYVYVNPPPSTFIEGDNSEEMWFSSAGGPIRVERLDTGHYTVRSSVDISAGNVQVIAVGDDNEYCKVERWYPTDGILVRCFTTSGVAADTGFLVSFVGG
jgi:hypothetical protein